MYDTIPGNLFIFSQTDFGHVNLAVSFCTNRGNNGFCFMEKEHKNKHVVKCVVDNI